MAPRKTKFSDKWLQRSIVNDDDSQAYGVNVWCEGCPNDDCSAHCKLYTKTFSIINMGFDQIECHAEKKCKA